MRIGFVLADLFTGSSTSMLPAVASMFSEKDKDCLIVFPGGRLKSNFPLDRMKNSIYRLVNPDNLDGSIIWSSSLTANAGPEDVLNGFEKMTKLPMVTIDGKTKRFPEIPDVKFNAYEGSRYIVNHCIKEHGSKKIAYIRGPENHNSANERFQAYLDVLKENDIETDPGIVSDPALWHFGAESMRQLLEGRGKIPGKDFDTVICASDLMLYGAVQELSGHGYEYPHDVIVCGFNDSLEARMLNIPATTMRLPYAGLGRIAVRTFRDIVSGRACPDTLLPMMPVIRRSCGCRGEKKWSSVASISALADGISRNFPIASGDAQYMVSRIAQNATEANIRELLDSLFSHGADVFEITKVMGSFEGISSISEKDRAFIAENANSLLPFVLDRYNSIRSYEERRQRNAFSSFNNELLEAGTVAEIADTIKKNISQLGFDKMYLVMGNGEESQLVGYDCAFSENLLVPEKMDILDNGVWICAPLCSETEDMGYLLMKPRVFNGAVCEEIRSVVSSALRSSMLFDAARRAQLTAENADRARRTFFANVSENLKDPLSEISDLVSESVIDEEIKKSILEKVTGASHIVDLALSETGELELNRYIANIGTFLSSFSCFVPSDALPCLLIDKPKLKEAIDLIISSMGEGAFIKAEMQKRGVKIDLVDPSGNVKQNPGDTGLSLAQKIFMLHGGTYSASGSSFSVILPYPCLSGTGAGQWEDDGILSCINRSPGFRIADVETVVVDGSAFAEKHRLPSLTGAVYWDSDFKGYSALTWLSALASNERYRNLPFICMDCPDSKSLEDSIRTLVDAKGKVILHLGEPVEDLYRWLREPEILQADIGGAVSLCKLHEPALVVIKTDEHSNKIPSVISFLVSLRGMKRVSRTPVIVCTDYMDNSFSGVFNDIPNVIVVNTCMLESEEFAMHVRAVLGGSALLATHTGAIVKKAQAFICTHATLPISRWQIADDVHVSEDYLTRIFKKELGLSPWDYVNRYRVWLAGRLLRNTGMSVNEISMATGFQDQAYFCRVFKKIKGYSPSFIRAARKSSL
ncbi:MAG: helix-turn-helix domain-containing protein [Spirochaetales bacterium]